MVSSWVHAVPIWAYLLGKLVSTRSVPSGGLARCSGVNKQMDLILVSYGVREVTEPADISTTRSLGKG